VALDALLKLQLDVGLSEKARTIQQVIVAGRVMVKSGRYRMADAM
jgi:hypothetical protein